MRPLKKETDAIAALLKQGADTPESLANAVIEELDRVRGERTTFLVVMRLGVGKTATHYGYGPYSTRNQAIKSIEEHPVASTATGIAVVPVTSAEGLEQIIERVDEPAAARGDFAEVRKDAEATRNGWRGKAVQRDNHLRVVN